MLEPSARERDPVLTARRQPRRRRSPGAGRSIGAVVKVAVVGVVLGIAVYPLLWLFLSSLKGPSEFSFNPVYALPEGLHLQNYVDALTQGNIGRYFLNSILVVAPSLLFMLILGVCAAFALEMMRWRGQKGVVLLFVAGILLPLQMVLLPLFTAYFEFGLLDTRWSLIITYTAFGLPLTIFLMVGYFKVVPNELMESAVVDGASVYQAFFFVALPMVANALLTVALVQFFFLWNDLLLSLTFINDTRLYTIQTGLLSFSDQYGQVQWGPTFAAISLTVFPTLIVFLVLNQKIIKGLTAGAVKG